MANPKFAAGHRIGIVNPLTLVGNEVKTILRERSFPFDRLVLLDSTGKEAGSLTEAGEEPAVVTAISDDELEDLDLAFFCGAPDANREWLLRAADDKFLAIDLSQPSTAEAGRVAIAGLNLDELETSETTFVSPHPIAIPIALLLGQLGTVEAIESCAATVVQPASEYDQAGIEELARQTVSVLNVQSVPQEVFDRQLAFNLYPASERIESFIVSQVRSLTAAEAEIALMVTQGTIFHSHTFSMFIRTRGKTSVESLRLALTRNPAIAFAEGDQQFGTIDAAGRDEVLVAELRADDTVERGFWLWAVCDNLRRGSALNAVMIAERILTGRSDAN